MAHVPALVVGSWKLGRLAAAGLSLFLGLILLLPPSAGPARAGLAPAPVGPEESLRISQAAVGRLAPDVLLRDTEGLEVRLSSFRGKPLVIGFIYTACISSCPMILERLATALPVARKAMGEDSFSVIIIGFDVARDTPERMRAYARERGVSMDDWQFLSGDLTEMAVLTEALGFVYFQSPKGFDHISQLTILDKEGRVHTQVYGDQFDTPLLVGPLKSMILGTPTPFASLEDLWRKVRWYCTVYDPAGDRYRFEYGIFISFFVGATVIIGVLVFLVRNWWRIWRNSRAIG